MNKEYLSRSIQDIRENLTKLLVVDVKLSNENSLESLFQDIENIKRAEDNQSIDNMLWNILYKPIEKNIIVKNSSSNKSDKEIVLEEIEKEIANIVRITGELNENRILGKNTNNDCYVQAIQALLYSYNEYLKLKKTINNL